MVGGTMSQVIEREVTWLPEAQRAPRTMPEWGVDGVVDTSSEEVDQESERVTRISFGWVLALNIVLWAIVAEIVMSLL